MKEMMTIVSDEYREGYAAFYDNIDDNPYLHMSYKWQDWEAGFVSAGLDWAELIGEKSV